MELQKDIKFSNSKKKVLNKAKQLSFWQNILIKHFFPDFENSINIEEVNALVDDNVLVFILPSGGMLEQWFLEYLLDKNDVCNIGFVNRRTKGSYFIRNSMLAKFMLKQYQRLRRKVYKSERNINHFYVNLRKREHSILFFDENEYRQTYSLGEHEKYLENILEVSREFKLQVKIIPIVFLWRRSVVKKQKLLNLIFGSSINPGLIRKIIYFFIRERPGFIRNSKIIDVNAFIEDYSPKSRIDTVRRLRREIIGSLSNEMKVILGPAYHSPGFLVEKILYDSEFQANLKDISDSNGETLETITERANENLKSIGSDYNFFILEFISKLGSIFVRNFYDRIVYDRNDFEKIKELGAKYPIIFVPSHKSHFDHCLLTWIFFWEGHAPPRVAAGDNLNFWPLGPILRKCGAFFIRRSFKGDVLYSLCLRFYIEYLVRYKYNQEFFIEGGRSRTGKLMYPRYGLLKYYVGAVAKGISDDLYFSPISIAYDNVAETASYSKEQSGEIKKKESALEFFKIKRLFSKNYGKAYLQFGTPISVKEFMQDYGINYNIADNDKKTHFIKKLAFSIMRGIDKSTIVTPVNLISIALLNSKNPGLYINELKLKVMDLFEYIKVKNISYSDQLKNNFDQAFRHSLDRLIKEKYIGVNFLNGMDRKEDEVYFIIGSKRLDINYYKNSILSFFVTRSIAMIALKVCLNDNLIDIGYFWENVNFLKNLLKFEFFFQEAHDFKSEIISNLSSFSIENISEDKAQDLKELQLPKDFLIKENRYLLSFFESYYTVARVLEKMASKSFNKKDLILNVRLMYEKLLWTGEVNLFESQSEINYLNALKLFESMSVIEISNQTIRINFDVSTKGTLSFVRGNLQKFIRLCRL